MRRDLSTWMQSLSAVARRPRQVRSRRPRSVSLAGQSLSGGELLDARKMLAVTVNVVGGAMTINLSADNDIAGLVYNNSTSEYEIYDNTTLVTNVLASTVATINVLDTKGGTGTGQVFEVRDNGVTTGAIAASLGVSQQIETTRIFDDVNVTSKEQISGGYGVTIGSPTIKLDDATLLDPLLIQTDKTKIQFVGVVTLIGGTDAHVGTGSGAGTIAFDDDILGGEDGAGTLTLTAGTGAITFGGSIGGYGGEDLGGVLISSAASVTATGKFHLDGTLPTAYTDGLTIGDGVNNVSLPNGGFIDSFGIGEEGAGIWFQGASTSSTIEQFQITNNDYGIALGGLAEAADLSGTVIDDNIIAFNGVHGIHLYSVAGKVNGEGALVIGGTAGNLVASNANDGIHADASTGVEITNNGIAANGFGPGGGSGIHLEGGGTYLINENEIGEDIIGRGGVGNALDGITIDGEDGAASYAGTVITRNSIQYNTLFGVRVTGVTLDTGEDAILITDNAIVNNGFNAAATPDVGGIRIDGSENIRIIDNLISLNGEDSGNGIDIAYGSHGTVVLSNLIAGNANNGVYVLDSSTVANPVRIGDLLAVTESTATTVAVGGDQRAFIVVGQTVYLATLTSPTDIITNTTVEAQVTGVSYDAVADETTLTFGSVSGSPTTVSLGNAIGGNGEDGLGGLGHGISVYASAGGPGAVVQGLQIVGNVIVDNGIDGIHLEAVNPAGSNDLSDIAIAGNSVGYDPSGGGEDLGNGDDGIEVIKGSRIRIVQNYVVNNGFPKPSVGDDENGIEIRSSGYVDIGEDGFGNYIANNAQDGVNIKGSGFVSVEGNLIEDNGRHGISVESLGEDFSSDILIQFNTIRGNGAAGVSVTDGEDIAVQFSVIENNAFDGVLFTRTTGTIAGNEILSNGEDGIRIVGACCDPLPQGGQVQVLGNIVRDNGDDGVHFMSGDFSGEDVSGIPAFSTVFGNTIERNGSNGVELTDAKYVLVGGPSLIGFDISGFPSDINVINLNGNAGVYASGETFAIVVDNEIDSNVRYGVESDGPDQLSVGYPVVGLENTIRRNGIAGVFMHGDSAEYALVWNNDISENPIGVMLTSASNVLVGGVVSEFPGEENVEYSNRIFDNGEGLRATGDFDQVAVSGNVFEGNLTGATLASARGIIFGTTLTGEFATASGNTLVGNNEGLRASGLLTGTVVAGNTFTDNTKVGIALQSARDLTVGGPGEDVRNVISGSPIGLSASGTMTKTSVLANEFSKNTIGISLSSAKGMTVGFNTVDSSLKAGISVTGNNAGTQVTGNIVAGTGDGPYAGNGIYLRNARNVEVIGNEVGSSSLAGLYVTGNTAGTVVENNRFTDNRIGMFLENATNAVFGGLGEDQGNTIVGGGDPLVGVFRDGILVTGTSTGSSITGTDISEASTGVWIRDAQGIEVKSTAIKDSKFYGFNATGDLTGSKFHDNFITNTVGIGGGLGHAMHLEGAQNLAVYDNVGEDSFGSGIYVTGDTSGTTVDGNLLDGNRVGITLMNATNAVIDGTKAGNVLIGGSDAANGIYRDGIHVIGTSTGSSIKVTEISSVTTGITLENATGVNVEGNEVYDAQFLGVNASGTLTGSQFQKNLVQGSGGLGALGHGIYLANALGLSITGNAVTNSTGGGLYATGVTTGTTVYDNDFDGNRVGIYVVDATNAVIGGEGGSDTTVSNRTTADGLASDYLYSVYAVGSAVYVGNEIDGLNISSDGGATFTTRTTADGLGSQTINGVFAVGSTVYAATRGGLSISTNGGATFANRTTAAGLGNNTVNGVYAAGSTVYAATDVGLSISTDGGTSFTNRTTSDGLGDNEVLGVYAVGSTVYAATAGGVSISTNGGTTFTNRTTAAGLGSNYATSVYAVGSTVYAGTAGGGLGISTDGGTTFTSSTTSDGLSYNFVTQVYAVGATVYVATDGGGLDITTDGGTTFTNYSTTDGLNDNSLKGVSVTGSTVYVASGGGLGVIATASNQGNRIVGGGNASLGYFRDGILASGTLTGSSITNTSITNTATGITLSAATGLTIANATVTGSQVWGLNASGTLTGTTVQSSTFTQTAGGAGGGAGVLLAAAQALAVTEATVSDNVIGLVATGNCAGSTVIDTTWSGNITGVINNSTGVPPLNIDPLP